MEWKSRLRIPGYWLGVQLKIALKPREGTPVVGIYNKIGHRYIPFFDYDDIQDKNLLYEEIRSLQEAYNLGNAYLFKTGKGYHVIMTDLLDYDEWKEIISASSCDSSYKSVPQTNGQKAWVLRISEKKKSSITFVNVLYNKTERWQSAEMIRFLKHLKVPNGAFAMVDNTIDSGRKILWAEYEA